MHQGGVTNRVRRCTDKLLPKLKEAQTKGKEKLKEVLKAGYHKLMFPVEMYDIQKDLYLHRDRVIAWEIDKSIAEGLKWEYFVGR